MGGATSNAPLQTNAATSAVRVVPWQPVRLVVVDSVGFHFRHDMDNAAMRTRRLLSFAQILNSAASKHNFAAVVVNQVSIIRAPSRMYAVLLVARCACVPACPIPRTFVCRSAHSQFRCFS